MATPIDGAMSTRAAMVKNSAEGNRRRVQGFSMDGRVHREAPAERADSGSMGFKGFKGIQRQGG
jgi:hypothetical protein